MEKAKAEERAAAEAKAQLKDEKKRTDALVANTAKLDKKIESLNQGLEGVGQDLKVVGQGLAGVGDKITNVSQEMKGVKDTVTGVGSKVEIMQKEVEETAAVQKENFRKLNERQTRSLNEIFTRYEESKIKLELNFTHKGGFLGAEKTDTYEMDTIIMVDGSFAYSLVHAKDSPFRLVPRPRSLVSVTGSIKSPKLKEPIVVKEVAFMDDPRILIIPLYLDPKDLRKTTSLEFFNAPENPHLFSEAVVIDSKQGRFGQTDFVRDEKDSRYIKVSHTNFAFITGAFDPGKGDLVFSQKGELLGIMVNNNYAFHVKNLGSRIHSGSRTVLGDSFSAPKTNPLLTSLGKKLFGLNKKFR
jgi:archaellum component FlaC